ncbi:MAG: hypothetical protein IPM52_01610 [Bacteroidetes bacterium]|nr:hypothetical protein [Bacteroidota bacterium]
MKKFSTLQPYFPEITRQPRRRQLTKMRVPRTRERQEAGPSQLALRNILGFAAACTFQHTAQQGRVEVIIN